MNFKLVQRFTRNPSHKDSISRTNHLKADYMGSAEFEFGALPDAYNVMKELPLVQTSVQVSAFDSILTIYVVTPADLAVSLQKQFQLWFDDGLRGKEETYLERVITRKSWNGESISEEDILRLPIAWWAIRENVFFSLSEETAKMWLDDISTCTKR